MMRKFILFFPLSVSLLVGQTDTLQQIRVLQDERVVHSAELLTFLNSSNPKIREHVLLAFANVQDTTIIEEVMKYLHDGDASVRSMAAFALGMLGKQQAVEPLFARLWQEKDAPVKRALLNAVGRCGSGVALGALVYNAMNDTLIQKDFVAEACGRFAIRRIKHQSVYPFLVSLLVDERAMESALYALMRYNDSLIAGSYSPNLLSLLNSGSPAVRMWTVSILGNSESETVKQRLLTMAQSDPDWRVRVNAIRALRNSQTEDAKAAIRLLVNDKNEHVSLTALTTLDGLLNGQEMNAERPFFKNIVTNAQQYSPRQRGEATLILGRRGGDSAVQFLVSQLDKNTILRPYIIKALGETKSMNALGAVSADIHYPNSLVSIVAVESYQKIAANADVKIQQQLLEDIVKLFERKDAGISYTIAVAFQDTAFSKKLRKQFLPQLTTAYDMMNSGTDLEPMVELFNVFAELADSASLKTIEKGLSGPDAVIRQAAEKAYKAITGKDSPVRFVKTPGEYKPFYAPDNLKLLSKYQGAEIVTSKGTIKIMFEKEAAPFTVLNFILLARKKFYDGLTFHRVVSNFVIQGGDPLGNGSGGPGYTIRTEVHPDALYTTGAVGMASAGKDTEGSQFFITHSATPHLDGRYTIFAYTKDLDVVDKIMVGDRIEKVVVY